MKTGHNGRVLPWTAGLLLLALVAALPIGCATSTGPSRSATASWPPPPPPPEESRYVLQPGDVISVTFFFTPRFDATAKIRPDGFVSLAPVDEVRAAGLTTRELDAMLTALAAKRVDNRELTVGVVEFSSRKIYVGGEVRDNGLYPMQQRMTVLQAILSAGGSLPTADLNNVVVIRRGSDEAPHAYAVNIAADLNSGDIRNDTYLAPFDVIYVPASAITKVDRFVDQYIRKLIPINLGAGFNYIKNADAGTGIEVVPQLNP